MGWDTGAPSIGQVRAEAWLGRGEDLKPWSLGPSACFWRRPPRAGQSLSTPEAGSPRVPVAGGEAVEHCGALRALALESDSLRVNPSLTF